jgi:hypothetical protein
VAGFVIIGHRGEGGFMGKFKQGGDMARVGEVINFGLDGFAWVIIRLRGWRWG